ncbi:MAG TPA: hypothetical protein VFJ57_04560 [Solirubrobacterales bacterium]|nr:hypothetical protein [Solirubrobacterales bacterium]
MKPLSLPRLRITMALALAMLAALVLAGPAAAAGKKKPEKPWNNPNKASPAKARRLPATRSPSPS